MKFNKKAILIFLCFTSLPFSVFGFSSDPLGFSFSLGTSAFAYGDDEPQKSTDQTQALLSKYPDLKVICAPTTVGIAAAAGVGVSMLRAATTYKAKPMKDAEGYPMYSIAEIAEQFDVTGSEVQYIFNTECCVY